MNRFQAMSWKLPNRILTLTRYVPPLGSPLTFDQCAANSLVITARHASRNQWSRTDLASAIGHDPHEPDASVRVWPPAGTRT